MLLGASRIPREPRSQPAQLCWALRRLAEAPGISSQLCFPNVRLSSRSHPDPTSGSELMSSSPFPSSMPQSLQGRPVSLPDTQSGSGQSPLTPRPHPVPAQPYSGSSYTALPPHMAATPIQGLAPRPGPAPAPWWALETTAAPLLCHHHLPCGPALSVYRTLLYTVLKFEEV